MDLNTLPTMSWTHYLHACVRVTVFERNSQYCFWFQNYLTALTDTFTKNPIQYLNYKMQCFWWQLIRCCKYCIRWMPISFDKFSSACFIFRNCRLYYLPQYLNTVLIFLATIPFTLRALNSFHALTKHWKKNYE